MHCVQFSQSFVTIRIFYRTYITPTRCQWLHRRSVSVYYLVLPRFAIGFTLSRFCNYITPAHIRACAVGVAVPDIRIDPGYIHT